MKAISHPILNSPFFDSAFVPSQIDLLSSLCYDAKRNRIIEDYILEGF